MISVHTINIGVIVRSNKTWLISTFLAYHSVLLEQEKLITDFKMYTHSKYVTCQNMLPVTIIKK